MKDDEFFETLSEQFEAMQDEETKEKFRQVNERWLKIAQIVNTLDLGQTAQEADWVEMELDDIGINVKALLMLGMRISISKNEPPMDFTARFTSGYVLGYVSALEDKGEPVLDKLFDKVPPEQERMHVGMLAVETRPIFDEDDVGLDGISEHMRSAAEEMVNLFDEPDDDWAPVLVLVSDETISMVGFDIPEGEEKHELFSRVIPQAVKRALPPANVVAFLVSAWSADGPTPYIRPSQHPDRVESLMLYVMDKEGDSQMWLCPIERHDESPPTLGEWKHDGDLLDVGGRVVTMLKKILS